MDADVIVVGGGACGLTAARDLGTRGLDVLVIEARDRLGGRTWTRRNALPGVDLEMGGMYVDRRQEHVWREIERYGIATTAPTWPSEWRWHQGGNLRSGLPPVPVEEITGLERAWLRVSNAAARLDPGRPFAEQDVADLDVPLPDLFSGLALGPWTLGVCQAALGEQVSGEWSAASALGLLANISAGGGLLDFFLAATFASELTDGTAALIDALADDGAMQLHLGEPVRAIEDGGGRVTVATDAGTYAARAVVSTLPLNVVGDVTWKPGLDGRRASCVRDGHVGRGVKIWAIANPVPDGLLAYSSGTELQLVASERRLERGALLVGFGSGPLDGNDPDAVQRALEPVLPGVEVGASCFHNWNADPYSKGTWAVPPAGTLATWQALPGVFGRIVFASGDIGPPWAGYIDGAIAAGRHGAKQALGLLSSDLPVQA